MGGVNGTGEPIAQPRLNTFQLVVSRLGLMPSSLVKPNCKLSSLILLADLLLYYRRYTSSFL